MYIEPVPKTEISENEDFYWHWNRVFEARGGWARLHRRCFINMTGQIERLPALCRHGKADKGLYPCRLDLGYGAAALKPPVACGRRSSRSGVLPGSGFDPLATIRNTT